MPTPISFYKDTVKEFEVDDSFTVSPVGKLTYLQEQVQQQRAIINRLLFDITISKIQAQNSKDDTTKNAHEAKGNQYKADLRQLIASVKINLQLIDELGTEYPELQI